jgi:hypothetical protein
MVENGRTMLYISAPMNGTIIHRILAGHLLGFGVRHPFNGSLFGFGGRGGRPSDMHRRVGIWRRVVKKLGWRAWRRVEEFAGSSRARRRAGEGRRAGIVGGQLPVVCSVGSYDWGIDVKGELDGAYETTGGGRAKCGINVSVTPWSEHVCRYSRGATAVHANATNRLSRVFASFHCLCNTIKRFGIHDLILTNSIPIISPLLLNAAL